MMRRALCSLALLNCCLGGAAQPAGATVISSSVSVSVPPGTYLLDDRVAPSETIHVTGTTLGSGNIDLNCYAGPGWRTLAADVPASGGTFSFSGSMKPIAGETCVLRAVPAGDSNAYVPGFGAPFNGPTLAIGYLDEAHTGGGALERYDLFAPQLQGAFEYRSLGACTIAVGIPYDLTTLESTPSDTCDAALGSENGAPGVPGVAAPTRSELHVDGANAYVAGSVPGVAAADPGFPSLTYGFVRDPTTGDTSVDESDQVVRCNPGGSFPPTSGNCTSLVPTGITVQMHIAQARGGRSATVIQRFVSTDGLSHGIDLLERNEFSDPFGDGELNFPWSGHGLQPYGAAGEVVPGPQGNGPGSFFAKGSASAVDGSEQSAQGAVTFSNPPDSVRVAGATTNGSGSSWVELHYVRTVPAGGAVPLGFTYSNAFFASEVSSDATAAEAGFRPSVTIGTPAARTSTPRTRVTASGTAADPYGLTAFSVNGRAVPVAANGTWSTTLSLNRGTNTIEATATNAFGNARRAQLGIFVIPAPVISNVRQSHRRWLERGHPRKGGPQLGTTFWFTLNEAAKVKLTFTRRGKRRPVGLLNLSGHLGINRLKFKGRLPHRRVLVPGRYTLTIAATDPVTGRHAATRKLSFTIVG